MSQFSKSVTKNDSIRIIGGCFRSRKIPVLDQTGLRPTTDRLRETLFNWLAPYISNDTTGLDLFAGSGALGLETLSRGAKKVIFIENQEPAIKLLKQTVQQLQINSADIIHQDALIYLQSKPKIIADLIFIDPPFHQDLVQKTISSIDEHLALKLNTLIYVESELNLIFKTPINWRLFKEKKTKQLKAQLFIVT